MQLMRLWFLVLFVNFTTVAWADTPARIKGPKEFDTPAVTRLGPLSAQDTLWRLAEQARPDKRINMYQMMYALYQKNPDAFLDDNFNHLKPGAFLDVPGVRDILAIDIAMAQRKSENDDRVWAERIRKAAAVKAEEKSALATDVKKAKEEITEELFRVESEQKEQLADLRDRMANSMTNVEGIVKENLELRQKLDTVVTELSGVKQQLDKDSEIQQQLQQLLAQQTEMLQQQKEQIRKQQEGFNFAEFWQEFANSQAGWILAAALPAALILMTFVIFIRRKSQRAAAAVSAATAAPALDPNYKSPLPPLDDSLDFDESSLINLDDSLLRDNGAGGIRLDDPEPVARKPMFADDDLLDDSLDLSEPSKSAGAFDLDDLLDEPLADLTPAAAPAAAAFDPDNILGDDALEALLAEENKEFVAKTEFDPNNILSGNELSSLFANLADDDDDLLSPDKPVATTEVSAEDLAVAAAQDAETDELLEEIELDLPGDEPAMTELTADDDFDIDTLVAQTQAAPTPVAPAPAVPAMDDEDEFDIDDLLAMTQSTPAASVTAASAATEQDSSPALNDLDKIDDIDDILAMAAAPVAASEFNGLEPELMSAAAEPEPAAIEPSEIEAFAESLVDEQLQPDEAEIAGQTLEEIPELAEFAEMLAAGDADLSVLTDEQVNPAAEFESDMTEFDSDLTALSPDISALSPDISASEPDLTALDSLQPEAHHAVTDDNPLLAEATDPDAVADALLSPVHSDPAAEIALLHEGEDLEEVTDADLLDELDEILNEVAEIRAQSQAQDLQSLQLSAEAQAAAAADLAEADFTPDAVSRLLTDSNDIEAELQGESLAETEYLSEFSALEEMPDLQNSDDSSVQRISEAISSVERPSRVLDSYPDLALDEQDNADIYPDDEMMPGEVVDELSDLDELAAIDSHNFDDLLTELSDLPASEPESAVFSAATAEVSAKVPPATDDTDDLLPDFVQIDKLLAATEEQLHAQNSEQKLNIDVGLADFEALIAADELHDPDQHDAGFAGQLDLIRAYIEIGDADSANHLIHELLASDAPEHVKTEAGSLLS